MSAVPCQSPTDAAAADNVTVVGTFPANSHPPIVYPAALIAGRDLEVVLQTGPEDHDRVRAAYLGTLYEDGA